MRRILRRILTPCSQKNLLITGLRVPLKKRRLRGLNEQRRPRKLVHRISLQRQWSRSCVCHILLVEILPVKVNRPLSKAVYCEGADCLTLLSPQSLAFGLLNLCFLHHRFRGKLALWFLRSHDLFKLSNFQIFQL